MNELRAIPGRYFLESASDRERTGRRFELEEFPVVIGRHPSAGIQLLADRVSREHARIRRDDHGRLWLHDLDSTNGTWLNGKRLADAAELKSGDVIHIGDVELRLGADRVAAPAGPPDQATRIGLDTLPHTFPMLVREFDTLLRDRLVQAWCQPIVQADGTAFGFELLGRGAHPDLDASPGALFQLAEALDQAVELSELLRERCFADAGRQSLAGPLFFNSHAAESREPERLLDQLRRLRSEHPDLDLVFEVHETAVTDLARMAKFRAELTELGIALAYDDFGAGQARLRELVEVPPDYLKFDIALVRGITEAHSARRTVLETLHRMIHDLGIRTLAEGIEDAATAAVCREIGIELLQGFHFGRPRPVVPGD